MKKSRGSRKSVRQTVLGRFLGRSRKSSTSKRNAAKTKRPALSFLNVRTSGVSPSKSEKNKNEKNQTPNLPAAGALPPANPEIVLSSTNARLRESVEAFLLDQRSEHTRRAYATDLKRFTRFLLTEPQADRLNAIQRTTVIRYKESLLSEKLSHTTIDRHMATLKSFFRWLVEDGVLAKNPAESVRFLNPKKVSSTQGFTDSEVVRMLSIPNLHRRSGALNYAILMVLFYCGLRRSELCSLRTGQIRREREQWVLRLQGKGNRERIVVLPQAVFRAIEHYWRITRRHQPLLNDAPVFMATRGRSAELKPLDPSFIYYVVVKIAKQAGIQSKVSPHSCRATAISHARDKQVPDRAIQEFAGWASPDMITRYDKRRTAVDQSASLAIRYGDTARASDIPAAPELDSEPQTYPKV